MYAWGHVAPWTHESMSPGLWLEGPQQLSSQPLRRQTFSSGPLFILSSAQTTDKPVIWLLMKFCTEQHGVTISGSEMSLEHMLLNAGYPGLTFRLRRNSPAVADPPSPPPRAAGWGHPAIGWGVGMVTSELLNKANVASHPLQTFNIFQRCVDALTAIFISKCPHLVSSMHKILAPDTARRPVADRAPQTPGCEPRSALGVWGEGGARGWLRDYLGAHHPSWGAPWKVEARARTQLT